MNGKKWDSENEETQSIEMDNVDTMFDELAKEIGKKIDPINLESKIRSFNAQRIYHREKIKGPASIIDESDRIISKATLRNISHVGVCLEVPFLPVHIGDQILVQFNKALNLEVVPCTVQWVQEAAGRKESYLVLGLQFKDLPATQQKRLDSFIKKIQFIRRNEHYYSS